MNTKVLSILLGLVILGTLGVSYIAKRKVDDDRFTSILKPRFAQSFDAEELILRIGQFKDWIAENEKQYNLLEVPSRFKIWNENYDYVNEHNAKNLSWTAGMNKFSDLSLEEFSGLYLGFNAEDQDRDERRVEYLDESSLAAAVDWRLAGAVTEVKNQGSCGGCYSFASNAGLEGLSFIKTKKIVSLSNQQHVDCSASYGNQGCNGGLMTNTYTYTQKFGAMSNSDYPYVAKVQSCRFSASKVQFKNTGYKDVPANQPNQLKAAVSRAPVPVAIMANSQAIQQYKSGIISANCGVNLDHAVTAIGYSDTASSPYWIIKNSWGTGWGEKGYFKIAIGTQNGGAGVCGVNKMATYPTA